MKKLLAILTLMLMSSAAFAFDHRHADWEALLKRHVVLISNGHASQVDYAGFKDLGSILQSPWKKTFFILLGQERSLDEVEHRMIRASGAFNDGLGHLGFKQLDVFPRDANGFTGINHLTGPGGE